MPAKHERPNILWYCSDQQRYDTIHALGNSHIHTPNIDALCEEGVAFTRAYTQSPICTPSRATFLTGRYPNTHHVYRNNNEYFPPHEVLVTKLLAEAGYDCALAGKLHLSLARKGNLERRPDDGYRKFFWSNHPNPDYPYGHDYAIWLEEEKGIDIVELYGALSGQVGAGVPTEYHQTTWCSEMAIRFITEKRDGPWLMSINPFDPHPPFDPPQEYLDRYDPETLPYPLFRESDIERQKTFRKLDQHTVEAINPLTSSSQDNITGSVDRGLMGSVAPSAYDARLTIACYYAQIELIDDQLKRIIDTLDKTGQRENTLIIYTSDHGELLGDHGLIYKGCRFFESLVHVPLIISWPAKGVKSIRSDALVELVDLAPTLLEAAGLEVPYSMQGKSLLPLLTGQVDPGHHKDHVISEYNDALAKMSDHSHGAMYFDGRYKIIIYEGETFGELFDLESDPGEFVNLWDDPNSSDLKSELIMRHFQAYLATTSAGVRHATKQFPGAGLAPKSRSVYD
jgi:arylsulfatase A-like enzyme